MPGGGLYKRVAQATATAQHGPDHLLQGSAEAKAPPPAPEVAEPTGPEDVCDVQAFQVWYWTEGEETSFVPETMYMNSKEAGHKSGEPRLIVSLSSFEALSQAYVMSVEKEGVKAAMLQEKEDLLQEVRVGYYKELQHLRELLGMAKEQMLMSKQTRIADTERKRMEEFERQVRETDVHYFNIVEYLEPELKEIMKDAVKQFNRHLMLENFNLRDRLALHEGTDGEEGLAERLICSLMGKGMTPAQIVKILATMITDKQQSDDFFDACRDILGIRKTELEADPKRQRVRPKPKEKPVDEPKVEEPVVKPVQDNSSQRELMKEMQEAKAEAERLREELEALRKQMEAERAQAEKDKADLRRQVEAAEKEAAEAQKKLKDAEKRLEEVQKELEKVKSQGPKVVVKKEKEDDTPSRRKQREDSDDDVPKKKKKPREDSDEDVGPKLRKPKPTEREPPPSKPGPTAKHDGPSFADLEEARRKAEEAEARLKELEARLKEAKLRMQQLEADLEEAERKAADAEARAAAALAAKRAQGQHTPTSPLPTTPGGTPIQPVTTPTESPTSAKAKIRQEVIEPVKEERKVIVDAPPPKPPKKFVSKPMDFIDRDFSNVDRGGDYSAMSGKPIAIIEEELARERKMRINLEVETRKMTGHINDLQKEKHHLDVECHKYERDLEESKRRLQQLIEEDESDGVSDVQIFIRWLIRRYGNLSNGFRALDTNRSGGMSVYEFCAGLSQMGWIKIVGRRLFKIIDVNSKGEIDMEDLERVFEKWVSGREDDPAVQESLQKAEEDMKAAEKDQLGEARERIRKFIIQTNELEDENKKLRNLAAKAETRAAGSKDAGQGMKTMERKVDLIKDAHDKLKSERDEVTSKMTTAMWKCREAHILQVKYMRQAEVSQEELKKLQKKYDILKAGYKKKHGAEPGEGTVGGNLSAGASLAAMSSALLSNPGLLKTVGTSFALEMGDEGNPDSARSARGEGALRCPKCSAVLRLNLLPGSPLQAAHTASPDALRRMLRDVAGSGDEAGGFPGSDSDGERARSPEDLIANLTDEDLLFGNPGALSSMNLSTAHKGAATYRDKVDSIKPTDRKKRWQLLFADAEDRRVESGVDGMGFRPGSPSGDKSPPGAIDGLSTIILSRESMHLLEHAQQVRGMWREAVSLDNAFPGAEDSLRGAEAVRVTGSSRSFGVGGAPVSQSMGGSMGGKIHLGPSRRDYPEPRVLQHMGSQASMASQQTIRGDALRSQTASQAAPPPPAFLEENNLTPAPEGAAEGYLPAGPYLQSELPRTVTQKIPAQKKQRELSPADRVQPPGHLSPPLQIVGNDRGQEKGPTPGDPSAVGGGSAPSRSPPERRSPRRLQASPSAPLVVSSATLTSTPGDAGPSPNFEDGDEGGTPLNMARGTSSVQGAWKRHFGKSSTGDLEQSSPQALGAGLPGPPEYLRSPPEKKGGLRRVPTALPTLDGGRGDPRRQRHVEKLSSSMPDLSVHMERAGNTVRTPPLAGTAAALDGVTSPNDARRRVRTRKISSALERVPVGTGPSGRHGAGDGAAGAAPFEAPNLYVGRPPPGQGQQGDALMKTGTGASHTIPSGMRKQFMMAANALELGSHVQRHAAADEVEDQGMESPLIVQHAGHTTSPMPFAGDAPRSNAAGRRELLK